MCTKAVSVNVRAMSEKLKVPTVSQKMDRPNALKSDSSQGDTLPTDYVPVITLNRPREIQFMRWGLIPHFATDPKQYTQMFNARAETLLELSSFRDLVIDHRCLILNEGFFERETLGEERVEWKISPPDGEEYFYMAGLWTTWRNPSNGQLTESCTMITTDPGNTAFGKIHDRIPIIMNKEQRRLWMNQLTTKEQAISMLRPCSDDMMKITEHGRKFIKSKSSKGKSGSDNFGLF